MYSHSYIHTRGNRLGPSWWYNVTQDSKITFYTPACTLHWNGSRFEIFQKDKKVLQYYNDRFPTTYTPNGFESGKSSWLYDTSCTMDLTLGCSPRSTIQTWEKNLESWEGRIGRKLNFLCLLKLRFQFIYGRYLYHHRTVVVLCPCESHSCKEYTKQIKLSFSLF